MPDLNVLIFDVDGTLADTEEIHRRAFNIAFREAGLDWNWTPRLYHQLLAISGGRERMQAYAESLGNAFQAPHNAVEYFRHMHRLKTAHYARLLDETALPLRPGVRRLLDDARKNRMRLAIASSTALANVDKLLNHNLGPNWPQWFEAVGTDDVIPEKKPSPAVYNYVLGELDVGADECVAFEDTPNGNRAALAAGITTVITTHYFTRNDRFPGATLVVDHLGEPDRPFAPRDGAFCDARYVDLHLLRRLHGSRRLHVVRDVQPALA